MSCEHGCPVTCRSPCLLHSSVHPVHVTFPPSPVPCQVPPCARPSHMPHTCRRFFCTLMLMHLHSGVESEHTGEDTAEVTSLLQGGPHSTSTSMLLYSKKLVNNLEYEHRQTGLTVTVWPTQFTSAGAQAQCCSLVNLAADILNRCMAQAGEREQHCGAGQGRQFTSQPLVTCTKLATLTTTDHPQSTHCSSHGMTFVSLSTTTARPPPSSPLLLISCIPLVPLITCHPCCCCAPVTPAAHSAHCPPAHHCS